MSATLHVIDRGNLRDIPGTLRNLAEQIERGEFGQVYAIAWTLDCNEGRAHGLMGGDHPSEAHLHFSVAAAAMVQAVLCQKPQL